MKKITNRIGLGMLNNIIKKSSSLILAGLFGLMAATGADAAQFVIFHTSDVHGSINAHDDPTAKGDFKAQMGGYAVLKNLINQTKQKAEFKGARFMYFDSGDFFQGTPIVDRTKGGVMIDLLNNLGANGTTLGNHEFDYSYENLQKQMKNKKFPVLCCNAFDKRTGELLSCATEYAVFAHDGIKIGVIGVDTPETKWISFEKNVENIEFKDPVPIATELAKKLKKNGCDFVIMLSHLGLNADVEFLKKAEGIDLILGGHTHVVKKDFVYAGPKNTPIVHSGCSCEHASVVTLDIDGINKPKMSVNSVSLYQKDIGEDTFIKNLSEEYLKDLRSEMTKVICDNKVNLYRGIAGGNSPAGFLVADAMRIIGKADVAFLNFGGCRRSIYKGKITVEDIFLVQPFENAIEIVSMTGAELKHVYELCLSVPVVKIGQDDKTAAMEQFNTVIDGTRLEVGAGYGFLIPSGVKIYFDLSKPSMHRITKMLDINGKEIDDNKTYKVAFNDFLVDGGDGFAILKTFPKKEKTDILVRDAVIRYIEELKVIEKVPENRIYNASLTEQPLE